MPQKYLGNLNLEFGIPPLQRNGYVEGLNMERRVGNKWKSNKKLQQGNNMCTHCDDQVTAVTLWELPAALFQKWAVTWAPHGWQHTYLHFFTLFILLCYNKGCSEPYASAWLKPTIVVSSTTKVQKHAVRCAGWEQGNVIGTHASVLAKMAGKQDTSTW